RAPHRHRACALSARLPASQGEPVRVDHASELRTLSHHERCVRAGAQCRTGQEHSDHAFARTTMTDYRKAALSKLRAKLFGPADGDRVMLSVRPYWRYLCGMLFPV